MLKLSEEHFDSIRKDYPIIETMHFIYGNYSNSPDFAANQVFFMKFWPHGKWPEFFERIEQAEKILTLQEALDI